MVAIQYRLPDVLPIITHQRAGNPAPLNPNFAALDSYFNDWIASQKICPSTKKSWLAVQMPLLASLTNPHMTFDQLRVCLEYMVMSLAMEDLTDFAPSADAKKWAYFFMNILRNPGTADAKLLKAYPMAQIVNDLSERVMGGLGPIYGKPFIESNDDLVRGMARESADRECLSSEATTSNVNSYMNTRRATIGVEPILVMFRWARGLTLPDDVLNLPLVKGLADATMEMVFLANDIYSYKKERIANAAQHNIISVAMHDESTRIGRSDIQSAFDYAAKLIAASRRRFDVFFAELKSTKTWEAYQQDLQSYADNMMDWAVGNVVWSLATPRYLVFDDPQTKETGVIEFHVDA